MCNKMENDSQIKISNLWMEGEILQSLISLLPEIPEKSTSVSKSGSLDIVMIGGQELDEET